LPYAHIQGRIFTGAGGSHGSPQFFLIFFSRTATATLTVTFFSRHPHTQFNSFTIHTKSQFFVSNHIVVDSNFVRFLSFLELSFLLTYKLSALRFRCDRKKCFWCNKVALWIVDVGMMLAGLDCNVQQHKSRIGITEMEASRLLFPLLLFSFFYFQ
jgi:hypothetical protein